MDRVKKIGIIFLRHLVEELKSAEEDLYPEEREPKEREPKEREPEKPKLMERPKRGCGCGGSNKSNNEDKTLKKEKETLKESLFNN
jgi:hypothetical protein